MHHESSSCMSLEAHIHMWNDVLTPSKGIIGARASAVLTDMVVLGITLKKARPIRVKGAKTGSVSAMASIIMRDGPWISSTQRWFAGLLIGTNWLRDRCAVLRVRRTYLVTVCC